MAASIKHLRASVISLALILCTGGTPAMPQDSDETQKQIDRLKKEKEQLEAETAKLEAEKKKLEAEAARLTAERAFEQARGDDADKVNAETARLEAERKKLEAERALEQAKADQAGKLKGETAALEAEAARLTAEKALERAKSGQAERLKELQDQKAATTAEKELTEAQAQALLAKYIGDVKAGPYSGTVDMKTGAGTEEALLLGAEAVREAADKIGTAILALNPVPGEIHIFAAKEFPNFQKMLGYRFRKELVKQAFKSAGIEREEAEIAPLSAGMISAGFEAFSKILGFFKTDTTIGNIEVKLEETVLLYSVAGRLKTKNAHLPLVYSPGARNDAVATLTAEISELVQLRELAQTALSDKKKEAAELEKKAADPQDPERAAAAESLEAIKLEAQRLNGVLTLNDNFINSLTSADTSGTVPINLLVEESAIEAALRKGAAVLLLKLENSGGGYLLKKNLLTGLGKMPLYHMGGATVSYLLLAGNDGRVLAGDTVAVYGGFVKTDDLRSTLGKDAAKR